MHSQILPPGGSHNTLPLPLGFPHAGQWLAGDTSVTQSPGARRRACGQIISTSPAPSGREGGTEEGQAELKA